MMQLSKPPVPNFEEAMHLLTHAEAEILRGEAQARVFIAVNAAVGLFAWASAGAALSLTLFLAGLGAVALGCGVLLSGNGGSGGQKDARTALYLDAIGERDSYADFLRSFTLLSATPAERVLHAVYLRSNWAKRKNRMVRLLGLVTLGNLAGCALVAGFAWL
ncbi:MAG: hypothetical protein AAF074_12870 [Pseudomonadota bacterium]